MTFLAIGHFFDVRYEARGLASTIDPNSRNVSFGLGKKYGEGIQFFVATVAEIVYVFYASWARGYYCNWNYIYI